MDDDTADNTRGPQGDRPSPDAYSLARLVVCLQQIASDLRQVAARIDSMPRDERRDLEAQLVPQLRELGDLGHEAARALTEMLLGVSG